MSYMGNGDLRSIATALLVIIPVGSAFRIGKNFLSMLHDEDNAAHYKKHSKNCLIFCAVAESLMSLVRILLHYYGG